MSRRNPSQRRRRKLEHLRSQGIEIREATVEVQCPYCTGGGRSTMDPGVKVKGRLRKQCSICLGNGTLKVKAQVQTRMVVCPDCRGSGLDPHGDIDCPTCGGEGEVVTGA